MDIGAWPSSAQVSLLIAVLGALAWPVKAIITQLLRRPEQDHELHKIILDHFETKNTTIDRLRALLDRSRRRENAYATGSELLLIAMPPELTPEQRALVARARALFETTVLHSDGQEGGG